MSWALLGTIEPGLEWEELSTNAQGGDIFRLIQSWGGNWPGTAHLNISFKYGNHGRFGFNKAYPDREPILLICPIAEPLISVGFINRSIAIRHNLYARLYAEANWQVVVEQWMV